MKVLVFGATGKIGSKVVELLSPIHEIIQVGSRSGDIIANYTDDDSVAVVFEKAKDLGAVVVVVGGDSQFKPYHDLKDDDFRFGAERKLVAQFRIVSLAEKHLNQGGSVTLTSGFLSHYPNSHSVATGPFNAAIDAYVKQAAPLLSNQLRLNVVSPAPVVELARMGKGLVSAEQVARYYAESIHGSETGKVYRAWGGLPVLP